MKKGWASGAERKEGESALANILIQYAQKSLNFEYDTDPLH